MGRASLRRLTDERNAELTNDGESAENCEKPHAGGQEEADSISKSSSEADFGQLLETGRVLWPTYFQLAAMTFAWNASLAAGFSLLYFQRDGLSSGSTNANQIMVVTASLVAISVIGIIYNAGALSAYVLMNNVQRQIIVAINEFPKELKETVTARLLSRFVRPRRIQLLKHLTHCFFLALCIFWLAGLIYAADVNSE